MSKSCERESDYMVRRFPCNVRDLLCLLAKDDDNKVTVVTRTCGECAQEHVIVVAVIGDLAVFRCHDNFKFVAIECICEIIVECSTILDELLEANSDCGHRCR